MRCTGSEVAQRDILAYPTSVLAGNSGRWPMRSAMAIGGILMAGWTVLLLWAVRSPIERRFVILLTALVVAALFVLALINVLQGNSSESWILVKCLVLFVTMLTSFILAHRKVRTDVAS